MRKLRLRYLSGSLLLIFSCSVTSFAWGERGHRLTARIASRFLTPQSQSLIVDLLKADIVSNPAYYQTNCPNVAALSNQTSLTPAEISTFIDLGLACIAPWPDPPLKWDRPYTSNWHFIDIPVDMSAPGGPTTTTANLARDCLMDDERGDCAINALRRFRPVLANPKEQPISRVEALKFIVHIIGDLHQPLHCVTDKKNFNDPKDLGDIGGNRKIVQFNVPNWEHNIHKDVNARWKEQWNLHSVWDEGIIDATMNLQKLDEDKYLALLLKPVRKVSAAELAKLQSGDLFTWIADSYSIAVKKAYKLPKFDPTYEYLDKKGNKHTGGYKLPPSYYAANGDVVSDQLLTGGLRLARFLNDTLAK
ncbi:MAG TPA: S1/P1 nuclease [Pyrinomonadaceae bacterium]|nr:S1/P1 nuclease [Pyrinomonadaceae bacterium]